MTADGAWCWFNEPRLLAYDGKLYASFVSSDGDVRVASLDPASGVVREFNLHNNFEVDDHDVPGLVVRSDGRISAYYSKHSVNGGVIYARTTADPGDVTRWGSEVTIDKNLAGGTTGISYPKPARVGSRTYLFSRGSTSSQIYIYSDDDGVTWTEAKRLFSSPDGRPYVNFNVDTATGRIDFIATNAHPTEFEATSLYHWYFLNGNVYKTDGTLISTLAGISDQYGLRAADVTLIYDGTTTGSWGWDVTLDATGKPVVAFASFPTDLDHRYQYARWTGSAWEVNEITAAGGTMDASGEQPHYSGGLAILPSDTNVVYLSRKVGTEWEIERWVTADGGESWASSAITTASSSRQVRPTTPDGHVAGIPEVVWMSGRYTTYLNFDTDLLMHPPVPSSTQ